MTSSHKAHYDYYRAICEVLLNQLHIIYAQFCLIKTYTFSIDASFKRTKQNRRFIPPASEKLASVSASIMVEELYSLT